VIKKPMEKTPNTPLFEKEKLIQAVYAEKKGRETYGENPFTCYVNIDSPEPDLSQITATLLDELSSRPREAFLWTKAWDKSVVGLNPKETLGCHLMEGVDTRGKLYVPVMTTAAAAVEQMVSLLPEGDLAVLGINTEVFTVDAFLICYLHLINELIWDITIADSGGGRPSVSHYKQAVESVAERGFVTVFMTEDEILETKLRNPQTSLRIYGSMVNKYVPKIMGAVIK